MCARIRRNNARNASGIICEEIWGIMLFAFVRCLSAARWLNIKCKAYNKISEISTDLLKVIRKKRKKKR